MDQTDQTLGQPAIRAERDDPFLAEKPHELDSTSNNGIDDSRAKKSSRLKSIFTPKSKRQNRDSEVIAPMEFTKDGKGDALKTPAILLPEFPSKPFMYVSSSENLAAPTKTAIEAVPSTSTNLSAQKNARVDGRSNTNTQETHQKPIDNTGKYSVPRTQSREQKKGVTIQESQELISRHPPPQRSQSGKRGTKRNGSSSCTRKSGQIEKPSKQDQTTLKKKYKALLSLVDELTEHCDYYKNALRRRESNEDAEKISHRKEIESLNMQIFKLGQEVDAWKEQCQKMENKSTALIKVKNLTQENSDLHADIDVHKSVIIRLNKELAYYQDKLRVKYKDAPENIPVYSSCTESTDADSIFPEDDWLHYPRKSLLPLLIAYDEVIAEKEDLLKDHEVTLDRFKGRCLEIAQENEALHQLISSNKDKGSCSIEEWEFLRSNAEIVLEENDLLHEQVENLKRKEEKLISTFQVKAAELKQTITQHEAEISRQKSIISNLEGRCKTLCDEHASMAASVHARIPREKHEAMVQEFKRAFDELKAKYEADKKVVLEKLEAAEKDRDKLMEDAANLDNENTHLRREIQNLEKNFNATTEALEQMRASLLETTGAREATNDMVEGFMKHVQQLASEKNKLVEDLNQQRLLNDQIMSLRSKENDLIKQLHDKIEAMEHLHNDEVKCIQAKVKELEETMKTKGERHRRESLQLHELLEEKDRRIQSFEESKKQMEQDLETVWRTTTSTMSASMKNRNT